MPRFAVLLLFFFAAVNSAAGAIAEVVWIDFNGEQHRVLFSQYDGEHWSEPGEIIYSSQNPLTTPVLGTAPNGDKILLWAEQSRFKMVLMSARGIEYQGTLNWQTPRQFSDRGQENMAPAIVTDLNGHLWVFWSSSTALPSDLYYRKFNGARWSDAVRVNEMNEVPDNGAIVNLDERGNVEVEWNTFDLDIGAYTLENRSFLVENSAERDLVDVTDPAEIAIPHFVPVKARSMMHFPGNLRTQSIMIGQAADMSGSR